MPRAVYGAGYHPLMRTVSKTQKLVSGPLFRLRQPKRIGLPQQEIGGEAGEVVMLMVWAVGDVTRRRCVTHEIGADGSVVTNLDRERRSIQSSDRRRERRRSPAMP